MSLAQNGMSRPRLLWHTNRCHAESEPTGSGQNRQRRHCFASVRATPCCWETQSKVNFNFNQKICNFIVQFCRTSAWLYRTTKLQMLWQSSCTLQLCCINRYGFCTTFIVSRSSFTNTVPKWWNNSTHRQPWRRACVLYMAPLLSISLTTLDTA